MADQPAVASKARGGWFVEMVDGNDSKEQMKRAARDFGECSADSP